jgi:monoterpene epsilon-lactone hydrolase
MLSPESEVLSDQYEAVSARMAAMTVPDLATMRSILEELHVPTAEPTGVTYDEVQVGGRPALWANPVGAADDRVILYFHGGGYFANSIHSHRKLAAHLAKASGCRTLLPDYRLAPENSFPDPLDDAVAAYHWLLELGIEPGHIVSAGDSAGGHLATALVLKLRDDGTELPAAIVGISPWYDMEVDGPTLVSNAATDKLIAPDAVRANVAMFLGGHSAVDPLANPLYADATGLPPVYLTCGGYEMFQDNAERFADVVKNANVEVVLEISEGMQHIYPIMAGRAPEADETIANIASWLRPKLDL